MHNCKGYNTKQRAIILDNIKENQNNHYTADELLDLLKANKTPVGRATLYRYLDYLVQTGEVKRFYIEEGMGACYQYAGHNCEDHYHLKCNNCGKLLHVDAKDINALNNKIQKQYGFSVDLSRVVLYGKCTECKTGETDA